ncbi:MAG: hypothetical protein KKB79_01920 [Nanoarchaeota archaeon]|nr:hypothetical protein [Nanoarchaeota archaeon]
MVDETKIQAVFILDIIGKPAEHLVDSLHRIVEKIGREKGVSLTSKDVKEPALIKDQEEFYSTFAEIELEVDDISTLTNLVFKYMPAHLEILTPHLLAMTSNIFNDVLNELIRRLHGYDEISRVMQTEKQVLLKKIEELGGEVPKSVTPMMQLQQDVWEEEE